MLEQRIGLIGAGQMATALARGFIKAGLIAADHILASDVDESARQRFIQTTGAPTTADNALVAAQSDLIFLAVKPQQMADVATGLRGKIGPKTLVVSIAAGVRLASLAKWFGQDLRIVRVMPNTPCLIGQGVCAYSLGERATPDDGALVGRLLASLGSAWQGVVVTAVDASTVRFDLGDTEAGFLQAATQPLLPAHRLRDTAVADLANSAYALMLRLIAYSYVTPRPSPVKRLVIDLALGLMRAVTPLAERAARLPAGPSNPDCHAGMSFTALRDAAPILPGASANRFFSERLSEIAASAAVLEQSGDPRCVTASRHAADLVKRAARGFDLEHKAPTMQAEIAREKPAVPTPAAAATDALLESARVGPPVPTVIDGVEHIEGKRLTLLYDLKKCIHARFCVTGAPQVFLANVKGPWIVPDAIRVESLVEIAHACPSGAIGYLKKDGTPNEAPPPVNLISIREAGPYAVRGDLQLDGRTGTYRVTLCRCGASKNKPYCDGSHHEVQFSATGEPPTGDADMLEVRDGKLEIDPQLDGPLQVRGNLEITSGTGRVVARVTQARLCRCGASANKPFCDGSHVRIGFRSQ